MNERYLAWAEEINSALEGLVGRENVPEPLAGAMRYSLLGGGKRLRGVLLLATADMAGAPVEQALALACGLEMIHCYSLIHDDLPAMDDGSLRHGQPANHRVFGEGMAVLAGDGLLTWAIEWMLEQALRFPGALERQTRAISEIVRAASVTGMVAGQCLDLESEQGRASHSAELLREIHLRKTAALLTAPVTAGLYLSGANAERLMAGRAYGRALGLAFQIVDDLLDVEGDAAALGKATGADAAAGKLTWPGFHGIAAARSEAERLSLEAAGALAPFGESAAFLTWLVQDLCSRTH